MHKEVGKELKAGNSYLFSAFFRGLLEINHDMQSRFTAAHRSLYATIVDLQNSVGWSVVVLGLPTETTMYYSGIKTYPTYKKTLADLCAWGLLDLVSESINQYNSRKVSLYTAAFDAYSGGGFLRSVSSSVGLMKSSVPTENQIGTDKNNSTKLSEANGTDKNIQCNIEATTKATYNAASKQQQHNKLLNSKTLNNESVCSGTETNTKDIDDELMLLREQYRLKYYEMESVRSELDSMVLDRSDWFRLSAGSDGSYEILTLEAKEWIDSKQSLLLSLRSELEAITRKGEMLKASKLATQNKGQLQLFEHSAWSNPDYFSSELSKRLQESNVPAGRVNVLLYYEKAKAYSQSARKVSADWGAEVFMWVLRDLQSGVVGSSRKAS